MKKTLCAMLVLVLHAVTVNAQMKMFINRTDGSVDSLLLSQIKNISFRTGKTSILSPELIAYYPFSGNTQDSSGYGNDGTNSGAVLTADRFGKNNSAYMFNGSASIRIPELFPDSCKAFTVAAWVKLNIKDSNNYHLVLYKGTLQGEAALGITYGKLHFKVNLHVPGTAVSTQNWYSAEIPDTLKANVYYFLVGRYTKGKIVEFLIDGRTVASTAIPDLNLCYNPGGTYSVIGTHGHPVIAPECYWNGVIDDVRIYNRALSDEEVQSLFHERGWQGN